MVPRWILGHTGRGYKGLKPTNFTVETEFDMLNGYSTRCKDFNVLHEKFKTNLRPWTFFP